MKDKSKKKWNTCIFYGVISALFLAYGIRELVIGDGIGAIIGFVAFVCSIGALIMKVKEINAAAKLQEELEKKATPKVTPELEQQLKGMLAEEKEIQAIKRLREATGMSLYDAKNFVDNLMSKE